MILDENEADCHYPNDATRANLRLGKACVGVAVGGVSATNMVQGQICLRRMGRKEVPDQKIKLEISFNHSRKS